MNRVNNIKSGDVLVTTNGNFMIVGIECCEDNTEDFFGWCAMFIDGECEYPLEIQYIMKEDSLNVLVQRIENNQQIIKVVKSKVILSE